MFRFTVQVNERRNLIGSDLDAVVASALPFLHLRNSEEGEYVSIGITRRRPNRDIRIGSLVAGETMTVPLTNLVAIWAQSETNHETLIECSLSPRTDELLPELKAFISKQDWV